MAKGTRAKRASDVPKGMGEQIAKAREARGLNQSALARKVGKSRSWVNELESGGGNPALGPFLRLCEALQVNPDTLLGYDDCLPPAASLEAHAQWLMAVLDPKTIRWLRSLSKSELALVMERGREAVNFRRKPPSSRG